MAYYQAMLDHFGPSRWWPGEHPLEIAVGAILTQNTNWRNVSRALDVLREKGALRLDALLAMPLPELEEALRPCGYFRLKARRLHGLLAFLAAHPGWGEEAAAGSLNFVQHRGTDDLREQLLAVKGIGPETADAILCYALERSSFCVDAYTRRIFSRHGLVGEDIAYHDLRDFFMRVLPVDVALYNEYHALIVRTGNTYCKKTKPLCASCPLGRFLECE